MYAALLLAPLLFFVMPLVMARVESLLGDSHAFEGPPPGRRPASHRRA